MTPVTEPSSPAARRGILFRSTRPSRWTSEPFARPSSSSATYYLSQTRSKTISGSWRQRSEERRVGQAGAARGTGLQTCALPICSVRGSRLSRTAASHLLQNHRLQQHEGESFSDRRDLLDGHRNLLRDRHQAARPTTWRKRARRRSVEVGA